MISACNCWSCLTAAGDVFTRRQCLDAVTKLAKSSTRHAFGVAHEVVTSPAQLVRHRLDRNHAMALGFLSLVKTLDPGTKPDGKVGQMNFMTVVHQSVDQPVPIVGRLDDNAL